MTLKLVNESTRAMCVFIRLDNIKVPLHVRILSRIHKKFCIHPVFLFNSGSNFTCISMKNYLIIQKKCAWRVSLILLIRILLGGFMSSNRFDFTATHDSKDLLALICSWCNWIFIHFSCLIYKSIVYLRECSKKQDLIKNLVIRKRVNIFEYYPYI